jgi:DNA-binding LytR/AlgR family response regulator
MPTAILADDETHLARYLQDQLKTAWPDLQVLGIAANGVQAAQLIDEHNPDVAFLDIQMPGMTGLDVAQGIEGNTLAVFVTAYDEYAVQAFEDGAVDYLLKPVTADRLAKCVQRVQSRLGAAGQVSNEKTGSSPADNLASVLQKLLQTGQVKLPKDTHLRYVRAHERGAANTPLGEQVLQIDVDEVLYFDAADKYTCVVLPSGEKLLRTAIAELELELNPAHFQRIHRSTLVNLRHVHATYRDESGRMFVRIKNHSRDLPVSRAYHDVFGRM